MAFNLQSWSFIPGSANNFISPLQDGSVVGAPSFYTYISATDTLSEIEADDYFVPVASDLNVDDLIYANGADSSTLLQVETVTTNPFSVTTSILFTSNVVGPGSSTNDALVRFSGTTGQVLQNSVIIVDDSGNVTGIESLSANSATLTIPLAPTSGGTGIDNGTNTITLNGDVVTGGTITTGGVLTTNGSFTTAGPFTTVGAYSSTFNMTGDTDVTFPTSGTLATTSIVPTGAPLSVSSDTNITLTTGGNASTALVNAASISVAWSGLLAGSRGGTGVNNGASTITVGGNTAFSGPYTFTGTLTGNTNVTFPTSGTLATTSGFIPTIGSSTNTGIVTWNGTTGSALNSTTVTIDSSGDIANVTSLALSNGTFSIDSSGDIIGMLSLTTLAAFNIDNSGNLNEFPQAFASTGSTAFNPAYTFQSDYHSGMYQDSSNTVSFSANQVQVLRLLGASSSAINALTLTNATTTNPPTFGIASTTDTNVSIKFLPKGTGQLLAPVGAVATPSYSFTGETNTGIWSSAANTLDFSTNSLRALKILSSISSAVNFLTIQSTATGNGPILAAAGSDTNIDLNCEPKGTGKLRCGTAGTPTSPGFAGPGSSTAGLSWTSNRDLNLLIAGATAFIVASNPTPPNPGTIVNAIAVYGNTTTATNQAWCPYFYPNGADVGTNNIDVGIQASYSTSVGGPPAGLALLADDTATYGGTVKFWNNSNSFYTLLEPTSGISANNTITLPSASGTLALTSGANVASVAGTTGQIDVSPTTGNVVVSIDSGYVGQTSITTLGTIGTGTWQGTDVGLSYGGTGASLTANNGGLVYSGASALAILSNPGTTGNFPRSQTGTAPVWSTYQMPASVTIGEIFYALTSSTITTLAQNTTATRYLANTGSSNTPNWDQVNLSNGVSNTLAVTNGGTGLSSTTANQILYSSATSTISGLATANSSVLVTSSGGVPSLSTTLPNVAHGTPTSITLTNGTGLPLSTGVTGVLPVANGGTGVATCFLKAMYYNNSTQTITTSTNTAVLFPSVSFNTFGSNLTYSSGLFTNTSGAILNVMVSFSFRISGIPGGDQGNGWIWVNAGAGSTLMGTGFFGQILVENGANNNPIAMTGTALLSLENNDNFGIYAWQNSGGNLNVGGNSTYQQSNVTIYQVP